MLVERLSHYFRTYKLTGDEASSSVRIESVYDRDRAYRVIQASIEDYEETFGA